MRSIVNRMRLLLGLWMAVFAVVSAAHGQVERPQILWQRTLEDAVALASDEHRPLLVAINVDGESASDRIVLEEYRDPRFVEATRRFVCVVASISRHNARDYDEHGVRIPCPRLGEVTCGEHIALEPILFDKYLGGERVSPRHALIQPDGKKSFDEFLLFDLHDLDRLIVDAASKAPPPALEFKLPPKFPNSVKDGNKRAGLWRDLAGAHDARTRAVLEAIVASARTEDQLGDVLRSIGERGDAGSIGLLRLLALRPPSLDLAAKIGNLAAILKTGPAFASILRARLASGGAFPGACGLGADGALLPLLARFDGAYVATRAFLLATWACGEDADRRLAGDAIAPALDVQDVSKVAATIEREGGPVELGALLVFSRDVGRAVAPSTRPRPELAGLPELEQTLVECDRALTAHPDDVAAMQRFGQASLDIARKRIELQTGDARLNLEDASRWLARASEARPDDVKLRLERARAAYFLGRFEEQERLAIEAFGGFPQRDALAESARKLPGVDQLQDGDMRRAATLFDDEDRLEALRWMGDAAARLLAARSGKDLAAEVGGYVRGARALAIVAASPNSDETDWVSLASYLSAIGLAREALAAWQAGVERLPESKPLRDGLNGALWSAGRIDLAPKKAAWIAQQNPHSAASLWYAGYASILLAEDMRRALDAGAAIAAYSDADVQFREVLRLEPTFEASARHYLGMCALGKGFAHLIAHQRPVAADELVAGLSACPTVADARDGLDRDPFDLVDGVLEWREDQKSPVDPLELAQGFTRALPGDARWPLAVADSQLREGLRADGRSVDVRVGADGAKEHLPSEEGDMYLRASIAVGRIALATNDSADTERRLAQSLTVQGERLLARDNADAARALITEAAALLKEDTVAAGADLASLRAAAAKFRAQLGEARPVFRPGR